MRVERAPNQELGMMSAKYSLSQVGLPFHSTEFQLCFGRTTLISGIIRTSGSVDLSSSFLCISLFLFEFIGLTNSVSNF